MSYIDSMVAPVPTADKDKYLAHAKMSAQVFKDAGALHVFEAWGLDLPEGKLTDYRKAVQASEDETVAISWLVWPDKAARDAGWGSIMQKGALDGDMPFDGKRMFFGGFDLLLEA